jgi:chitodextrinase
VIRKRCCPHAAREGSSPLRGSRRNRRPADKTPAVSAARINTALTRASLVAVVVASLLAGTASGASARSARVDKRAPTVPTNLRVSSATATTLGLAWDASHDRFGVKGYGVYLNGTVVATSSQPAAFITGLACGRAYTVGVDAYDEAGNHSRRAWATVATAACPDQQAPSAPTGFRQQAATQNEVVLAWDPSSDNIGVVGYGVYRNGLLRTSTAAPTVTLSGFLCGSAYEVAIDAVDAAGNRSQARSTWVTTAACSDTQPPAKPILSLGPATETSLVLNWQPGVDNVGVDHYNVFLNGTKVAETSRLTWTYTGLVCGTDYSLGLEVEDAAGNKSALPEGTLAPVRTSACSPEPPPADMTAPSQPGSLAVAAATTSSVTLAWTASTDNVGVAGYGVYLNGASVQTKTQPGATVSGLACGTAYTLAVDAYDSAGNRSTKASLVGTTALCADTLAPSTPANVVVTSRTATSIALSWSPSSDNVGVAGYTLYRGGNPMGTTGVPTGIFSNLPCGSTFTLAVDSYDAAGNRSAKATITASTTTCPDTTPPSMPTGLSTSNVTGASLTLSWNASTDNVGVAGYDVYRNGAKVASVAGTSSSHTGLVCGTSYAFAVVSYDAAGNRSSQAQLTAPTTACVDPPSTRPAVQAGQSWDAACEAASPGDVIPVAAGTHPAVSISCFKTAPGVTFRAGSDVLINGELHITGSNITVEGDTPCGAAYRGVACDIRTAMFSQAGMPKQGALSIGRGSTHHVNVKHVDAGEFFLAADDVNILGGDYGPTVDQTVQIATQSTSSYIPSRRVVIDGALFHDFRRDARHMECIFVKASSVLTIRNSVFRNCAVFHIFYQSLSGDVLFDGQLLENNRFQCNTDQDLAAAVSFSNRTYRVQAEMRGNVYECGHAWWRLYTPSSLRYSGNTPGSLRLDSGTGALAPGTDTQGSSTVTVE